MAKIKTDSMVTYSNEELMDLAMYSLKEASEKSNELFESTAHAAAVVAGFTNVGNLAIEILKMRHKGYTDSLEAKK